MIAVFHPDEDRGSVIENGDPGILAALKVELVRLPRSRAIKLATLAHRICERFASFVTLTAAAPTRCRGLRVARPLQRIVGRDVLPLGAVAGAPESHVGEIFQ